MKGHIPGVGLVARTTVTVAGLHQGLQENTKYEFLCSEIPIWSGLAEACIFLYLTCPQVIPKQPAPIPALPTWSAGLDVREPQFKCELRLIWLRDP